MLELGLAVMRIKIRAYKSSSKRKKIVFELSEEQFREITQMNCYYCGAKPNNVARSFHSRRNYVYGGLDRVDNTKGYTIDNVVPCCKICNRAKGGLTVQEFRKWIKNIYNKSNLITESNVMNFI